MGPLLLMVLPRLLATLLLCLHLRHSCLAAWLLLPTAAAVAVAAVSLVWGSFLHCC
jgi:hypothetical protein